MAVFFDAGGSTTSGISLIIPTLLTKLAAYYTFEDGTGLNVADSSGHGYTGTWTGTVSSQWSTTHKFGTYAGYFNGTDYVSLGTSPALLQGLDTNCTVTAWVKPDSNGTGREIYAAYQSLLNGYLWFMIRIESGTLIHFCSKYDGQYQYNLGPGVPLDSSFHFIACRVSGSREAPSVKMWCDSTASSEIVLSPMYATPQVVPITIGGNPDEKFVGLIDAVGVWNRALTDEEIAALYNSGSGRAYPFS